MIVSWDWLRQYVALDVSAAQVAERLMMAGLNHEETVAVGDDLAIDLEVTSNRPDCLGHLGVAREAAVLFHQPLRVHEPHPVEAGPPVASLADVALECPALCPRYTARVIRGAHVKPSPAWLVKRLATVGVTAINNVVDVTNYVLWECGQPLHAFDLARLAGGRIVVREGRPGEKLEAIDHRTYELGPGVCVIADAERPVGIGGIMGGAGTEVTAATRDLLIEAAEFDPATIRATSRRLGLASDSSYRFERGLDPHGVDWASRRACELILELAGGELAVGAIARGRVVLPREPLVLRLDQLERVLGIAIPRERVIHILNSLGCELSRSHPERIEVVPPTWRRDLEREIDLVEEVARVHGYDAIPEDVRVPMAPSARSDDDRMLERIRHALVALGCDEALTISLVERGWSEAFSPWTTEPSLEAQTPLLRNADQLRRSLVPSLLGARRTNESLGNAEIELFEVAHVYLPTGTGLPREERVLGLTSGGDYLELKGRLEQVLAAVDPTLEFQVLPASEALLDPVRSAELWLADERVGIVGEVSAEGRKQFELRGPASVAELRLDLLRRHFHPVPTAQRLSTLPAVDRDVNLVVAESVTWAEVAAIVRAAAPSELESLAYRDTYRHPEQIGPGRKSLLFTLVFRGQEQTLTGGEVDQARDQIVAACTTRLKDAALRA